MLCEQTMLSTPFKSVLINLKNQMMTQKPNLHSCPTQCCLREFEFEKEIPLNGNAAGRSASSSAAPADTTLQRRQTTEQIFVSYDYEAG